MKKVFWALKKIVNNDFEKSLHFKGWEALNFFHGFPYNILEHLSGRCGQVRRRLQELASRPHNPYFFLQNVPQKHVNKRFL